MQSTVSTVMATGLLAGLVGVVPAGATEPLDAVSDSSFDVDRQYDLEMVIQVESKPEWANNWQATGGNRCSFTMQGAATLICDAWRPSQLQGLQEERVTISVYADGELKQEWSGPIPPEG